jgi:hypothetical protein
MVTQSFIFDETEILTQAAEALGGIGSLVSELQAIQLARKYYNLYNQQRQFYYNVFQNGAERTLAAQAYGEPAYVIDYVSRIATAFNPATGPLSTAITDVPGWVNRHAGMYAQTLDPDITELEVDNARIRADWANYLFRFEELWADVRNDTRWSHRLTLHNVGIKQATAISAALSGAVAGYQDNMHDLSSQLATYANGIAKYAGYRRGLADTADEFSRGTSFSRPVSMKVPDRDISMDYDRARNTA